MAIVKYVTELSSAEFNTIKEINPKIYEQLRMRIGDSTYEDILVCIDKENKTVFFDYVD